MGHDVVVLGVFVVDAAFRCSRLPKLGETLIGTGFHLGPGGKGSNQAVAAAKAGADVGFIARIGEDSFADIGLKVWAEAGVTPLVIRDADRATGAAGIFIEETEGRNAIVISPGAAGALSVEDVERHAPAIAAAQVVMTQLEQPLPAAQRCLQIAHQSGVTTIFNPAPAAPLPPGLLPLCDYVTPNEEEAKALTGVEVRSLDDAEVAAKALLDQGVRTGAVITLGSLGALYHDGREAMHIPPMSAGAVVDTTGAGDAFNGGFAAALADGAPPLDALRFATATAALSVTAHGTAASMPSHEQILKLIG